MGVHALPAAVSLLTDLVEMEVNSADHRLLDKDIVGSSDALCENHGSISILTI